VCCSVLQCVAGVRCSVLQQCVAVWCNMLQHIRTLDLVMMASEAGKVWGVLECVAMWYSSVQECVAVCCSRVL